MNFDWSLFLRLAETWHQHATAAPESEAMRRSAISRAYYAAFHTAATCAQSRDPNVIQNVGEDHSRVIRHYKNAPRTDTRRIGLALDRLRENRRMADYDDQFPDLELVCRDSLTEAKSVIAGVAAICRQDA